MDRRVVLVGGLVGLAATLVAWWVLGSGDGRRTKRERVGQVDVAAPVRVDARDLQRIRPGVGLRPEVSAKLHPDGVPAGIVAPPPEDGVPAAPAPGVYALDQDGISAAVRERTPDLQACYETAKYHTPGLAGTMTLTFAVVPDPGAGTGHVASVDVDTALDATVFEGCVVTVFEELRFATTEPTTVRYPVTFSEAPPAGTSP